MFDILAHRLFIGSVQCLCARDSVFCVCTLCFFFHPIRLEGSIFWGPYIYLEGHIYIWRVIYIWRAISIFGGPYIFGEPYLFGGLYLFESSLRSSKAWIILTLRYQLRQKWRHWSLEIRTMYQGTYTLYVYIHHVYTQDIPSIWSGGQR